MNWSSVTATLTSTTKHSYPLRVQHQVKVFDQFLKHRKPKLSQHLVSASFQLNLKYFIYLFQLS